MSDKPSTSFIWPSMIAAVLAVYGYATFQPLLETARPPAAGTQGFPPPPSLDGVEGINARLWEDPLSVVYENEQSPQKSADPETRTADSVRPLRQYLRDAVGQEFSEVLRLALGEHQHDLRDDATANLLVLPVLLPGDRYGDDRERRMRIRYSVISGLSLSDYRPKFYKRLSVIRLPILVDGLGAGATQSVEMKIPVEMYLGNLANGFYEDNKPQEEIDPKRILVSNDCDHDSPHDLEDHKSAKIPKTPVLVCWIDENQLGVRPLASLAQILDHLLTPDGQAGTAANIRAQVRILGPCSSDVLVDMAHENRDRNCFDTEKTVPDTSPAPGNKALGPFPCGYLGKRDYLVDNVRLYSPMATIAQKYLRNTDLRDTEHALTIFTDGTATASGVKVFRTIGNDLHLAYAVKRELQLRGAWPDEAASKNNCHVVLIAERDTEYGRAIIENYSAVFGTNGPGARGLTTLAYLRGLDGESHNENRKSEKSGIKYPGDRNETGRPLSDAAEPEGKSQYDYLDRLNRRLIDVDRQMRDHGQRGITAIGVVGSDVFDKLLIMRAMRKSFPNAQFFTTDLDANFWRKTEFPSTRNVIVASHFGLTLHPDLQRDAPPFRNSYQTSFFLATLLATGDTRISDLLGADGSSHGRFTMTPRKIWEADGPIPPLKPLLFEIGRYGPFQLTTTGGDVSPDPKKDGQWRSKMTAWHADAQGSLSAQIHPPSSRERLTDRRLWQRFVVVFASAMLFTLLVAIVVPPQFAARQNMAWAAQNAGGGFFGLWKTVVASFLSCWGICLDVRPRVHVPHSDPAIISLRQFLGKYLIIAAVIALATVSTTWLIFREHVSADGEPFGWFEGISIWPSMILLAISAVLSAYFLWDSYHKLKDNQTSLRTDLELTLKQAFESFRFDDLPTFTPLSVTYVHAAILTALFFLAAGLMFGVVRWPFVPYRGAVAGSVSYICSYIAYALLIWLTQFVLIHVRSCRASIKMLDKLENTGAPCGLRQLIEFIARRTDEVGKMLQYPFIILLVMYIAQLGVFDDWRFNFPLIVLWGVLLASLFWAALQMRRDAQNVRRKIVRTLTDSQAKCSNSDRETTDVCYKDITTAINREERGAYRVWTEDHLLRALAIPLGGSGGLLLLQQWILN